jgi:hypothetical protein
MKLNELAETFNKIFITKRSSSEKIPGDEGLYQASSSIDYKAYHNLVDSLLPKLKVAFDELKKRRRHTS